MQDDRAQHYTATANQGDDQSQVDLLYSIHISDLSMTPIQPNKLDEAFSIIDVECPNLHGVKRLKLKVDTGASANTLPLRTVRQMYGDNWSSQTRRTNVRLTAYKGSEIKCLESISLKCKYKESVWNDEMFFVVDVPGPAIAGLPTCRKLQMVTIHTIYVPESQPAQLKRPPAPPSDTHQACRPTTLDTPIKSVEDLKTRYPHALGNFKGEAHLYLKNDAKPTIDAPRKCSIHLKPKLQAELDKMEKDGVIRPVTYHTDWCSSITTSVKKDGSLRICLDPKRLNNSLKRCPHKIPTLEELNPAFSNAKFFSKLDAKAGYWSVHLDDESQDLTTFWTPFGRYCFRRLPFGLAVSQDIFQQGMDRITDQVLGCVGIADDIAVSTGLRKSMTLICFVC